MASSFLVSGLIQEYDLAVLPGLPGDGIRLRQPSLPTPNWTGSIPGFLPVAWFIGSIQENNVANKMFKNAIVRAPSEAMIRGITTAGLGLPDYELALKQHQRYVEALRSCGLEIISLPADPAFPDSCFVEDTALLTKRCAIIARLGAAARQGEEVDVRELLPRYFNHIESIEAPGTVEPGDIMMVGNHFYIGLSGRTNPDGARQMIALLKKHGCTGSTVVLTEMLHLKTGLSYLEDNTLVACGEFLGKPEFADFNVIAINTEESYAANCIWVNGTVIVPAGFPDAVNRIESAGYSVIPIDVSEFQKLDGGLSCLSLRF